MRSARIVLVLLAAVGLLGVAAPAAAQTASQLSIGVEEPPKAGLPHRVAAQLRADGAVNGVTIRFFVVTDLYGPAFLGSAVTDATGTARVVIEPRHEELRLRATFAGSEDLSAAQVEGALVFPPEAVVAASDKHAVHGLLAPIQQNMPVAIAVAVALLWLFLGATSARVLLSGREAFAERRRLVLAAQASRPRYEEPLREET